MLSGKKEMQKEADYIIIGAGLAGLTLALSLLENAKTAQKRILIMESDFFQYPSRTWCFWEKNEGSFQHLVQQEWRSIAVMEGERQVRSPIASYTYKMVSSAVFRDHAVSTIEQAANILLLHEAVLGVKVQKGFVTVETQAGSYLADMLFDSRVKRQELAGYKGLSLLQQFRGWFVETEQPVFDTAVARLMDFRTPQKNATAFFYVLPQTARTALVEYTLFTAVPAGKEDMEEALREYMEKLGGGGNVRIVSEEEGVIPMTDYPFRQHNKRIIPIGVAGGCTKPSSGYTYTFIQRQAAALVRQINAGLLPRFDSYRAHRRFLFYDRVLLRILSQYPERGSKIFYTMFSKNSPAMVLKFLNNDTSVWEELRLFTTLPIGLFSRTALKQLFSG